MKSLLIRGHATYLHVSSNKSKHGVKPSCLGKGGNLPTDEISQHFNLERKVIYYDNDKRTGNP